MKPSTLLTLAPFLASAAARPQTVEQPTRFDVVAVSEGPVQYLALAISSSFFYLGKGSGLTDSFCPPNVEKAGRCPPGKDTDTVAPGQMIYVDSNYAVRATDPYSSYLGPDGKYHHVKTNGTTDGFKYIPGAWHGTWNYQSDGIDGFLAFPYTDEMYQVFANSKNAKPPRGQKVDACFPFTAGAFEYDLPANTSAAAWEY